MSSLRKTLVSKALDLIYADKPLPVDLEIHLNNLGVDPDALRERHEGRISRAPKCDVENN